MTFDQSKPHHIKTWGRSEIAEQRDVTKRRATFAAAEASQAGQQRVEGRTGFAGHMLKQLSLAHLHAINQTRECFVKVLTATSISNLGQTQLRLRSILRCTAYL
jgi:hypothetical protein